ncbi:MAG: diaminopimelate epimerase [Bacteroidetes bacterium]|jgi:diaminopimelate epimerase|nr:diaminopimelate epimerase [Bacteroidota bacterium]
MTVNFYKYHGTGNDFIIIDNRTLGLPTDNMNVYARLCDRHFGIGADGLMFLQNHSEYDFEMVYLNADGRPSSMCGNGGRCMVAFANMMGLIKDRTTFLAVDGEHEASIRDGNYVVLKMNDVSHIKTSDHYYFLDTGSPHHVEFHNRLSDFDIYSKGKTIRNASEYQPDGTNVNFVEDLGEQIFVRTYERGVENETFACGTGVVAAAISTALKRNNPHSPIDVKVMGGLLKVRFKMNGNQSAHDVWLEGPAEYVFKGLVKI